MKNKTVVAEAPVRRRAEGVREFAASVGISYDSALRRVRDGRIHTIRIGKRRLIPAEECARILREGLE